jgi:carbon monoxide dehydrogenase subunit G
MDIEKTLLVAAPPAHVWSLLLDPNVMGACVPGMQSIEVVSDVEYVSVIHVKIAFVSAKFRIKTTIVEQRAPHYLRTEGTGEDASVASSLKQSSEIFLTDAESGQTELRMKIHVDVLGRLGTFGLSVMKTKADRMWEEFAQNLAARLAPAATSAPTAAAEPSVSAVAISVTQPVNTGPGPAAPGMALPQPEGWWSRTIASLRGRRRQPTDILVEIRKGDTLVTITWPAQSARECAGWLQDYLKQPT